VSQAGLGGGHLCRRCGFEVPASVGPRERRNAAGSTEPRLAISPLLEVVQCPSLSWRLAASLIQTVSGAIKTAPVLAVVIGG